MCRDLAAGVLDFAVLYTPHADPDLHFTSLGEIRHRLISSHGERLADIAYWDATGAEHSQTVDPAAGWVIDRSGWQAPFAWLAGFGLACLAAAANSG